MVKSCGPQADARDVQAAPPVLPEAQAKVYAVAQTQSSSRAEIPFYERPIIGLSPVVRRSLSW